MNQILGTIRIELVISCEDGNLKVALKDEHQETGEATLPASPSVTEPVDEVPAEEPIASTQPSPAYPTTGDAGFSSFPTSVDSQVVYVSSSTGNDSNDGLSQQTPVKSIQAGAAKLRDGYPDQLLLKRGDVWTDETLGRFKSGRGKDERLVVAYYGDNGPRPLIKLSDNFIDHGGHARSNLAFIGLDLISYKANQLDPQFDASAGITALRFVGGGDNILLEDCRLRHVQVVAQSYGGHKYCNFEMYRTAVLDNWALGSSTSHSQRPQGIYASGVDGLRIEECFFDHNGWNARIADAGANMYNHNIYLATDNVGNKVVVRNNIITRASSHGVHGRPGGLYEDNLLVRNSVGLQMGYRGTALKAGTFARANNNVILEGKRMDPDNAEWPRTAAVWGLHLDDIGQADVKLSGNIVAHQLHDGSDEGIANEATASYENNIQYKWGGGKGETTNPGWQNPELTVGDYHRTLGGEETLEAFLDVLRNRELGEWNEAYTAEKVNAFIQAGFSVL